MGDPDQEDTVVGSRRRSTVLRLMVCSLLLGLVTMHHAVQRSPEPDHVPSVAQQASIKNSHPDREAPSAPTQHRSSVLGHLCLAVLTGTVLLLLSVLPVLRLREVVTSRSKVASGWSGRAPPAPDGRHRPGFAYDLCVLRL